MRSFRTLLLAIVLSAATQCNCLAREQKFRVKQAHDVGTLCERKLDLRYPYLVGGNKKIAIRVNRAIQASVNRQIGPFWPGTEGMSYQSGYEIEKSDQRELKVAFKFDLPSGGAHGGFSRKVKLRARLDGKRAGSVRTSTGPDEPW